VEVFFPLSLAAPSPKLGEGENWENPNHSHSVLYQIRLRLAIRGYNPLGNAPTCGFHISTPNPHLDSNPRLRLPGTPGKSTFGTYHFPKTSMDSSISTVAWHRLLPKKH